VKRYRTIVADPPWEYEPFVSINRTAGKWSERIEKPLPYPAFRHNAKVHSRKPEGFLDRIEQVSPGPYVELFARRSRFGWDTWGDESLQTAEMPAA
jgi:N6-adenosine-specific RNA methylase IME4